MWKTSSMWVAFFSAVVTTLSLRSHIRLCMRYSFIFSSIDVNNCWLKPGVIDLCTLIACKYNLTKLLSCITVVLLGSSRADQYVQYMSVLMTTERALLCLCVASNCASGLEFNFIPVYLSVLISFSRTKLLLMQIQHFLPLLHIKRCPIGKPATGFNCGPALGRVVCFTNSAELCWWCVSLPTSSLLRK